MRILVLALAAVLVGLNSEVEPSSSSPKSRSGRVARLYIYTDQNIRPRHRNVVGWALKKKARVHSSVFAEQDGEPLLELGPISSQAKCWEWRPGRGGWQQVDDTVGWPFVAVLEYEREGQPKAFVDWFRRTPDSEDGGAWHCDPEASLYADHINAQTACGWGGQYSFMALVDTPSGDDPRDAEWLIRARVTWEDGTEMRGGWWLRFHTPENEPWYASLLPLVDWTVVKPTSGEEGEIKSSRRLLDPDELGLFGTRTVFKLPPIPPGVDPCRGS